MPIVIRKKRFPTLEVRHKDVHIGFIDNEEELYMFRADIVGCEDGEYTAHTPRGVELVFDRYGIHNYCEEVEGSNKVLGELVEKQMKLRIENLENNG